MPKSATTTTAKRPRKALEETPSTVFNQFATAEEDIDPKPLKKAKKTDSKPASPKVSKQSSAEPPAFLSEITLPGEEAVHNHIY